MSRRAVTNLWQLMQLRLVLDMLDTYISRVIMLWRGETEGAFESECDLLFEGEREKRRRFDVV